MYGMQKGTAKTRKDRLFQTLIKIVVIKYLAPRIHYKSFGYCTFGENKCQERDNFK